RDLHQIAAVQVDSGGSEIDGADVCRGCAVCVQPGRIRPLPGIIEQVELDSNALANPAVAVQAPVTELSAAGTKGGCAFTLNGKREAAGVSRRRVELEEERRREFGDIDDVAREGAGILIRGAARGELQVRAADRSRAVEREPGRTGKSAPPADARCGGGSG